MRNIAIFASGSGTNAENLILYFQKSTLAKVQLVLTNNPKAFVIQRAEKWGVQVFLFNRQQFYDSDEVNNKLLAEKIDFVVLAGFLWLMPLSIINLFPRRMINIHPALLPSYGGKGMYGMKVHESVIANGEKQSGITIHYVNEHYDKGDYVFQANVGVNADDSPESLALKIHQLEYDYLPVITEQLISKM